MMRTSELNLQTSRSPKVQSSPMAEGLGSQGLLYASNFNKKVGQKKPKRNDRRILKDESFIRSAEVRKIRSANYNVFVGNEMIQSLNEMGL